MVRVLNHPDGSHIVKEDTEVNQHYLYHFTVYYENFDVDYSYLVDSVVNEVNHYSNVKFVLNVFHCRLIVIYYGNVNVNFYRGEGSVLYQNPQCSIERLPCHCKCGLRIKCPGQGRECHQVLLHLP